MNTITALISLLSKKKILQSIHEIKPHILSSRLYMYKSILKTKRGTISAYGVSSEKKHIALEKCIYEGIERISPFHDSIGSGFAAGIDPDLLALSGIYELLERDALMLSILSSRYPIRRVDPHSIRSILIHDFKCTESLLHNIHIYDITNDLKVPTYVAAITLQTSKEYAIGIKSNQNAKASLRGAIEEAFLEAALKSTQMKIVPHSSPHIPLSYSAWKMRYLKKARYVSFRQTPVTPLSKKDELAGLLKHLKRMGITFTQRNITPFPCRGTPFLLYAVSSRSLQKLSYDKKVPIKRKRLKQLEKFNDFERDKAL